MIDRVIDRLQALHERSGYGEVRLALDELRKIATGIRELTEGDEHICTCGDCETEPYSDRCRYELHLRSLITNKEVTPTAN